MAEKQTFICNTSVLDYWYSAAGRLFDVDFVSRIQCVKYLSTKIWVYLVQYDLQGVSGKRHYLNNFSLRKTNAFRKPVEEITFYMQILWRLNKAIQRAGWNELSWKAGQVVYDNGLTELSIQKQDRRKEPRDRQALTFDWIDLEETKEGKKWTWVFVSHGFRNCCKIFVCLQSSKVGTAWWCMVVSLYNDNCCWHFRLPQVMYTILNPVWVLVLMSMTYWPFVNWNMLSWLWFTTYSGITWKCLLTLWKIPSPPVWYAWIFLFV